MPDTNREGSCTAAVDLPDVRCDNEVHPHRGSHHATRRLDDGTRVSVFWWNPGQRPREDEEQPATASQPFTEADPPEPRPMPPRLRRTDYAYLTPAVWS